MVDAEKFPGTRFFGLFNLDVTLVRPCFGQHPSSQRGADYTLAFALSCRTKQSKNMFLGKTRTCETPRSSILPGPGPGRSGHTLGNLLA